MIAKKRDKMMIFIALFFLMLFLKLPILNMPYHWDAMCLMGEVHNVKVNYFIPFCCYRFPVHPIFFACAWSIFGDSLLVSHLLNIFIASIGLYFTYLLGGHLFSKETGIISALLLLFCPLYFAQSGILNFSILLTTLNLSSIYFALKNRIKWYLLSASLLMLTKEVGFLTIFAILIYQYYVMHIKKKVSIRKVFIYGIPLIVLVIWRMLPAIHLSRAFYYSLITFDWFIIMQTLKNRFLELFINDFRWILTFFIGLGFIAYRKKYRKEQILSLVLVGIIYFSFFAIVNRPLVRYLMPVYPLFFIMGAASMVEIFQNKKLFLYLSVIVLLGLSVTQYNKNRIVEYNAGSGAVLESNMEYLDTVITHQQAAKYIEENYPDATVLTTWPQIDELSYPHLGYVEKPIKVVEPPADISAIDLIYYSPQSHEHLLLLEKIKELNTVLVKRFERNSKYTEVHKVIK
ncbi:glycosyltransferase family 39 protein [bacterium]|nr:glycosyltransferase family 39 protein [bacterium]MBU4510707.1 glycosyltransferase family 39 protein [bacterium]